MKTEYLDLPPKLHVRRWRGGAKPPFLLVHGLASNAQTWDGVARELAAAGHPVAAVDQRGHGRSEKPDDGYDFATVTADLQKLIEAIGWDQPYLVGQSWGGNVVLAFGQRYPRAVRGLGFVDGGYIDLKSRPEGDWESIRERLKPPQLIGTPRVQMEQYIRTAEPDWSDEGIAGTLANFELLPDGTIRPWLTLDRHMKILYALWQQRPAELYPHVEAPVLICAAENGDASWTAAKRRQIDAAVAGLPRAEVAWFAETAHDIHVHRPVALARRLLGAIDDGFWPP